MSDRLQYISQGNTAEEQVENIQRALEAGCSWIQLRFKNATENELMKAAELTKDLCAKYNATFIINDHVDLAKRMDADGVHLGLDDMPVHQARRILGSNKIIGGTANTLEDVLARAEEECAYIGLGPFRFTTTKEKLSPVLGKGGYEFIMNALTIRNIQIPVYAIGGITKDDVEDILRTGVYGIAVSGAITSDPERKVWIQKFNALQHEKIGNSR